MKKIAILGSTGSIGTQTLDVARENGDLQITALAAGNNIELLEKQIREFHPGLVAVWKEEKAKELKDRVKDLDVKVVCGMDGLLEVATEPSSEILVTAIVGMIGIRPTIAAMKAGKDIALANKETLVAGGNLVMKLSAEKNVKIYPVDSEHSAIFQCLQGNKREQLKKIILTASGGPFFGKKLSELENVSIEQALNHPNWSMGNKITIDSATLMNKGLEFIEAKWLFDLKPEQIEVVVHRQSVVHSAVEYNDNSVIAQMGTPDMKIPIQYALLYPDRFKCDCKPLSLTDCGTLTFEKPDYETFKCLSACVGAITMGGAYPCIVNGANEEAVKHFLGGKISFNQIGNLVNGAFKEFKYHDITCFEDVIEWDKKARDYVLSKIN